MVGCSKPETSMPSELSGKVWLIQTGNVTQYSVDFRIALLDFGRVVTIRVRYSADLGCLFPSAGLTYINGHYYAFDLNSTEERLFKAKVIK